MNARAKTQVLETEARRSGWMLVFAVLVIGALLFVIASIVILYFAKPQGRLTCEDFTSYWAADKAFRAGNKQLDGNSNGIPCENLLYNQN